MPTKIPRPAGPRAGGSALPRSACTALLALAQVPWRLAARLVGANRPKHYELGGLSDHLLKDIGLTRFELTFDQVLSDHGIARAEAPAAAPADAAPEGGKIAALHHGVLIE
ncbi:MAG: DUF1127 domain-containing protein [Methylobacteriaceae bacterium]|nr:DUF1127 domain-containing protein [Methylobacteriaceae bacterium]